MKPRFFIPVDGAIEVGDYTKIGNDFYQRADDKIYTGFTGEVCMNFFYNDKKVGSHDRFGHPCEDLIKYKRVR